MELELTLKESCNGLKAVRATERKKSAENLKEFLMRNAVPALLSENTLKKRGYSWRNLFDDINEYILKETEKYETSKTFDSVTGPLCANLLHLCVTKANKGKAYIKCDNITDICLYVLNDNRLAKAIGDSYLNLLFKDVLPCEYYLGFISPSTWKGLLDVSVAACFSSHSKLDSFAKLRLVLLILKCGKENSQFVRPVIDALPSLEKYFMNISNDKKVQDVVTEIIVLLLEMLSSEYRLTMCHFIETMLPIILKFYDQNKDQKKKIMLFKLLYLAIALHHPQGKRQNEEGSLASNWAQWNKYLNSVTELICLEVAYMQKARRQNDRTFQNCSSFHDLAASVYYQVFKLLERNDNEDESASKKLRLNFNKNKTFSDLVNELQQNHIPWMGIIQVYVKKYSGSISTCDYLSLVNSLQTILANNSTNLDWDVFEELTCLVLQNLYQMKYKSDEYDNILVSLWNSCVRNCNSINASHKAVHVIIQHLMKLDTVKCPQTQILMKLYTEKDMPVTTHSVKTLSTVFEHCYSKCSSEGFRLKCFSWLTAGDLASVCATSTAKLLLRLIANDNVIITPFCAIDNEYERLREILFDSNEKCILFSEFEIDNLKKEPKQEPRHEQIEFVAAVETQIQAHFKTVLIDAISKLRQKEGDLLHCIKIVKVLVSYLDVVIRYNIKTRDEIEFCELYGLLKRGLTPLYSTLNVMLQSNAQIPIKITTLQLVKELLMTDFDYLLANLLRSTIEGDLFHGINNVLNTEVQSNDNDISIEGDEDDMNFEALKHHCYYVLAAYCRKEAEYREEILKLILDDSVYSYSSDLQCMFQTIEILTESKVEDPPLGLVFTMLQSMCQKLYRNAKASYGILKVLVNIIDKLCLNDTVKKNNCVIMIKSYLRLCGDMYYPARVACLVYECAAKLMVLNDKQDDAIDKAFEEAFMSKIKGCVHNMRLYCCYLLKLISNYWGYDTETLTSDLLEIFLIDVASDSHELVLKDEAANRTATVLHCFLALAQSKTSAIQSIILEIIFLQKDKSLDKHLIVKVLNRIVNSAGIEDLTLYLNNHILTVAHFWFTKNYTVEDLPITLFGYDDIDMFIEKHKGWLITGDILWRKNGNVRQGDILQNVVNTQAQPIENILEMCFSNIIALCLPYIVSEKYNVDYYPIERLSDFKKSLKHANKMFKETCEILENSRWSGLFVENVGELLLLAATHMRDYDDTELMFDIKLTQQRQNNYYPKRIFVAILEYFETLIDENVIQYLCKNQATTIFTILFRLWKNVLQESIFEWKVLALHAYVTFLKSIPLGFPSDAFVCNYACNSLTHAIKKCNDKNEMKAFTKALRIMLDYLLPIKASVMRKSLLELLPVLIVKKEGGFGQECASFLDHLRIDMKDYLRESEDVVDYLHSMSQGSVDNGRCANLSVFKEKLRAHELSLNRPSHETLLNIRHFFICNKENIHKLYNELDTKKFSEDCANSLIHKMIHALCNILKSGYDEKTVREACNCLSEISSYDLKTLVTVPPADTERITNVNPKDYFALVTIKALLEVFFDEDPNVTNEVSETLINLMKCFDIDDITDLEDVDKQILKPLSPAVKITNDTKVDGMKFEQYNSIFPDGIFLNALLNKSKDDWLKEVTCTLLEFVTSSTNYVSNLREVCILKSHVCRKILPALIGLLLQCLTETRIKAMGAHINKLFNFIFEQTFENALESSSDSNYASKAAETLTDGHKTIVQYMLDIVDFVRVQRNYYKMRPGEPKKTLNILELEYDKVAWAAAVVDQNWAAIYYGEIWAVFQNEGLSPASPEATTSLQGGENLQRIFRKCYVSIGEIDAIEGCGTAHLTIENEKRKHLINTGQYTDALLLHDIALSCGAQSDPELEYGVVRSLHKSGMHHLALRYIRSLPENDQLNDVKYDCLAFLGDWSDFVDIKELEAKYKQKNCNQNSVVKAFQYACLKNCLNIQTAPEFEDKLLVPLSKAKLAVSRLCHNLNMENCQNIYKILEKLHMFRDIEDYFAVRSNRSLFSELLQRWDVENLPQFQHFKHIEALCSQRVVILDHAAKTHNSFLNEVVSLQIQYSKMALNNQRVQMAQRLLAMAKKSEVNDDIALVESEISWAKGHKELALSLLRNIVNKQSLDTKLAAVALRRYGLWMADSKRDNPRDIINKYLRKSLNMLKPEHVDVRLKVYRDIAKFADTEYKQVVTYMNSSVFENRVKCVENMKGTESDLIKRSQKSLTKEEGKALATNKRFKELDEAEIANTRAERENYLQLAMKYYLLSLRQCNDSNLSVFRVISLWLDNRDFEFPEGDSEKFADLLHSIPSWKFVTILPQLAPRLDNEDSAFINNLKKLLKRCSVEHPHHTLPILFLLKNSDKDNVILNASARGGSSAAASRARSHEPRVVAAAELVTQLRDNGNDTLTSIIDQMDRMCDAIISFANHVAPSKAKKQKIPDAENIHKLRRMTSVPVPTVTLPIKHDCNYSYIPTLQAFDNYYELVGGVNCPKKINCKDSSGKNHILLIKGGDDLKQDAVMQQVFNIVNTLLEKDPVTNRNKLLIRTYKVVPLSRLSGVLQWCEGTLPLGLYLVGANNSGAHSRYRHADISCDAARKQMIDCANDTNEVKKAVYDRIVRKFKPVFHYFFTEHYLDPVTWYERRLAYTKSVATSSMVGYILGLGDRHVYNILIDEKTAEVIHIDLGIAFDQGKTLRTPETVPFRLTRDIIAGFGCSGTEGIFRRCCEKTMQLLRDNQETLLTILEVLLCDPLYSWSVKTAQQNAPANRNNTTLCGAGGAGGSGGSASGLARRALLVVSSKLRGTDDGGAAGVAVPGQVARLLHAATDPFNLCRLFHGWQPYL